MEKLSIYIPKPYVVRKNKRVVIKAPRIVNSFFGDDVFVQLTIMSTILYTNIFFINQGFVDAPRRR